MSRNVIIALIIMALVAVLLIFNTNVRVDINLVYDTIKSVRASLVYLAFVVIGVLVGILLK
jgi:hypothetical protein